MGLVEILESAAAVGPEIVLGGAVLVVLLAELAPRARRAVPVAALLALAAAGVMAAATAGGGARPVFRGALAVDGWASFFRLVFLASSFLVGAFSIPALRGWASGRGEFFVMLLACTLGMLLAAGASDLLMVYLSLEFVGLSGYVLAGLRRGDRKGAEASLKYLLYGAAASGFLVYGLSFLYGLTGTLQIGEVGRRMAELRVAPTMRLLSVVLVLTGFGFKVAAVPFHMWCPDVYEGAPTPVAAFLSVGPKAAGFAVLARFLAAVFPPGAGGASGGLDVRLVLALLSALTMAVGNLGALHQQSLKRLLAYSAIAHAGYLLLAFAVFTADALAAVLFYLAVYAVMNLGAFLAVLVLEERHGVRTVDECRGLGWRAPGLCGLTAVFLFSLTGLPPTAGFAGKLLVFSAAIRHGLEGEGGAASLAIPLVILAVVFTVVSLFYYARVLAAMFLLGPREGDAGAPSPGAVYGAVLWFLAAGTLGLGLFWGPLDRMTRAAAGSIATGTGSGFPG